MPILPEIYVTQWGVNANLRNADCGVACIIALLEFYGLRHNLTVDQLVLETTLATRDTGLTPQQLVDLAASHGLATYSHDWTTLDDIKAEIDAGRPVIVLIAYRFILGRLDQGDRVPGRDGHFITIVGYDDTHFVANDPDYWVPYAERGHNTLVPLTQLDEAMAGVSYYRRCVFVKDTVMATSDEITRLKAAIGDVNACIKKMQDVIDGLTPTQPAPPVVTQKVVYTTSDVNIRSGPVANGDVNKIGAVKASTQFTVKVPAVNGWFQIAAAADSRFVNGYVFGAYLSDGG